MSAIEERIRKLLALADSPNENEAAAAAEKAQALMLRYGIEMAAVAASGGERLAVDEHVVDGKVDPWRRMLAAAVARSAGGQIVWAPGFRPQVCEIQRQALVAVRVRRRSRLSRLVSLTAESVSTMAFCRATLRP